VVHAAILANYLAKWNPRPPEKSRFHTVCLVFESDFGGAFFLNSAVRPDGAYHQWRKDPSRELSIALVADERFGRATGWIEAS
jgi:hypothetical protein